MLNINTKSILNLAFPLTIILFILFTKWWIVDVVDGTDGIMYGFPLIYKAPVFYSSITEQYFIMELTIDFLIYFIAIFGLIHFLNKYIVEIKFKKTSVWIIRSIAIILFSLEIFMSIALGNDFLIKRNFDIEVKQIGFKFYFSNKDRDEFNKLHK